MASGDESGPGAEHRNWSQARLVEEAIRRGEGGLADNGALVVLTGKYTGRSPKDKFIVQEPESTPHIDWGAVNQPFEPSRFDALYDRVRDFLDRRETWRVDAFAGADPTHRLPIRVICERVYHALFARQLLIRPSQAELARHEPAFTILAAPDFLAVPERDGTRTETFVILNFARRIVLIGGTLYAGEIKKSVFSLLNYLLPRRGILSMHCSANVGAAGDVAIFFGLSGTGKTTLSTDPARRLIGDDEHGWSDDGVFNIEGGCYAKCIRLSPVNEPEIFQAIRFGTVLENVVIDPITRKPDYADAGLTENTRAAYPIHFIPHHVPEGRAGHPSNIVFLTCDAFGILPPISRLTPEQAMYHFLSGYTAKVAGTERGLGNEPQAVFSTCFGAPFLPLRPRDYAELLGARMRSHRADAWLVNTGWTGGPFGVGQRVNLPYTRAMVAAVLNGALGNVAYDTDPIFGLAHPRACPGVPPALLNPREAWADRADYDTQADSLARRFHANFARFGDVPPAIAAAGPKPCG